MREQRVVSYDGSALAAARRLHSSLIKDGATATIPVGDKSVELGTGAAVPLGDGSADDPLYAQAAAIVPVEQRASVSLLQRHLRRGYNRAASLLETMEAPSVVSAITSNGNRSVKFTPS